MTLDDDTKALCRSIRLDDLPPERIWGEIEKLLLRAERPSIGFALALELGVIDQLFPELKALVGCVQEPEWHPEGDVWVHTLQVIDQARQRIGDLDRADQLIVMLGAVTHDFGKPATTAFLDGRIRSMNHEEEGRRARRGVSRSAERPFDRRQGRARPGARTGRAPSEARHAVQGARSNSRTARSGVSRRKPTSSCSRASRNQIAWAALPGTFDCSAMDWFLERARELGVDRSPPKPLLLGRHLLELGMTPGPEMGALLKQIYEKQLDGEIKTTEEGIALASQIFRCPTAETPETQDLQKCFVASSRLCGETAAQAARS